MKVWNPLPASCAVEGACILDPKVTGDRHQATARLSKVAYTGPHRKASLKGIKLWLADPGSGSQEKHGHWWMQTLL